MNKKLRLLVTEKCPNNCKLCCNKQFDLNSLPIVSRFDYDEVCITGGEPLLFANQVKDICRSIIELSSLCLGGKKPKIYIYTSIFRYPVVKFLYGYNGELHIDGFTMTPHSKSDIHNLYVLNKYMLTDDLLREASFRLCLFPEMRKELDKYETDLPLWQVKDIDWLENCPLPEGEDFCRISNLF